MKKYLIIILSFILLPAVVFAEECDTVTDTWCTGSTCLSSLQRNYNLWSTTGNDGKTCIKVIAKRDGNDKSYLSGKNPQTNYVCSNGNDATYKLVYSALPDNETNVTECQSESCYIPEVWLMDCGTSSDVGNTNNENNNIYDNNHNDNINNEDNNNNDLTNEDVTTNEDGQITGTTDASDTGVETYFIILFVLVIVSYMILVVSKKKNLFKSI